MITVAGVCFICSMLTTQIIKNIPDIPIAWMKIFILSKVGDGHVVHLEVSLITFNIQRAAAAS